MEARTDLLYLESLERGYDTSFEAKVLVAKPEYVVLDRTLFYPRGGGQDWDTGRLVAGDREVLVGEVTKRGPVRHVVGAGHGLEPGDAVQGEIDWRRRHAHMRMHTAQHLVSGIAYDLFGGARTVGNQLHADRSRIDLRPVELDASMLRDLEAAANDAVRAGHRVSVATMTREELGGVMPADRTNVDLLPRSVRELRVIRIGDDVDLCPCAGTHVLDTREIGEVQILGRRSKGAGTQRLEYTLAGLGGAAD